MVIIPCFQKVLHRTLKNGRSANVQIRLSERNCYVRLYKQPLEELHRHQVVILNHSLSGLSNVVRMATAKVDQGATSPTTSAVFHPRFLKFLTRFHKKSTHRSLLRTLMHKTQKKIINNGAATHRHKFAMTNGLILQNCANRAANSENRNHHQIHRPTIYKTLKFQAQRRLHAHPRAATDSR